MIGAVLRWWMDLLLNSGNLAGPVVALVLAALAALIAANVVIWTLVGVKSVGQSFTTGFHRSWTR